MVKMRKQIIFWIWGICAYFSLGFVHNAQANTLDLQDHIDRAQEGATIQLKQGVYKGPITITKPITIRGEPGVVIDGGQRGNVITISTDHVTLSDLTILHSGKGNEVSGIFLNKANHVHLVNNHLENVHFGIYIKNGTNNEVVGNVIKSYDDHFSARGNGIHIFKGKDNRIANNEIRQVQDGIYFDFATEVEVTHNVIVDSRYGMHFMYSNHITATNNVIKRNITGLMVMDSSNITFLDNAISEQFHFRGFGVLIYQSKNILLKQNEIIRNSVAVSFEKAENTEVSRNIIAANQVGLEFRRENKNNLFFENNFVANILSANVGNTSLSLDNGEKGNYWDDYRSFDITGDLIGEIPYKAGSIYDHLLQRQPLWQFFFESPAIQIWSRAETMFPSFGVAEVYDNKPFVEPLDLKRNGEIKENNRSFSLLLLSLTLIGSALLIIYKGRKYR